MVFELKKRPKPRSPNLTTAEAVTNTFAGLISEQQQHNAQSIQALFAHYIQLVTSVHDSPGVHVV